MMKHFQEKFYWFLRDMEFEIQIAFTSRSQVDDLPFTLLVSCLFSYSFPARFSGTPQLT